MSYTLPRPAPYSTAQPPSPSPLPQQQPTDAQSPSWLPPQQPAGGGAPPQSPPPPNYSPYGPSGMPPVNANGGYGSMVNAWQFNPPPWTQQSVGSPGPNPAPAPRSDGSQPPEIGTRQPASGQDPGPNTNPDSRSAAFGGGMGAQHPVDVFHQMVQHPHGQAILQSLGYTPPQQPAAQPQQPRATPTVPNPGFPTPR